MENPSYFLAIKILNDHGVAPDQLVPVPVDEDGLNVDAFDRMLHANARHRPLPRADDGRFHSLLFLVPTYSNPTGTCLSTERRIRLVEIAKKNNVLIVCDDMYQLLSFPKSPAPPNRIFSYDNGAGVVISNCSFSKLLSPGLRLGWMEAAPALLARFQTSGIHFSGGITFSLRFAQPFHVQCHSR